MHQTLPHCELGTLGVQGCDFYHVPVFLLKGALGCGERGVAVAHFVIMRKKKKEEKRKKNGL